MERFLSVARAIGVAVVVLAIGFVVLFGLSYAAEASYRAEHHCDEPAQAVRAICARL